jgi:hypothetical protein
MSRDQRPKGRAGTAKAAKPVTAASPAAAPERPSVRLWLWLVTGLAGGAGTMALLSQLR